MTPKANLRKKLQRKMDKLQFTPGRLASETGINSGAIKKFLEGREDLMCKTYEILWNRLGYFEMLYEIENFNFPDTKIEIPEPRKKKLHGFQA